MSAAPLDAQVSKNWVRSAIKAMLHSAVAVRRLGRRAGNCVLLTFDDGPTPEVTPGVLERLKAHDARAVFFVVGRRLAKAPQLLKEILGGGHVIGNHSYMHPNGPQPRLLAYRRDVLRCQDAIEEHTGYRPRLFRPPLGRVSPTTVLASQLVRFKMILWTFDSADWRCRSPEDAENAARRAAGEIRARDIVLLHDDNRWVLRVLDKALPFLKAKGYDLRSAIEHL